MRAHSLLPDGFVYWTTLCCNYGNGNIRPSHARWRLLHSPSILRVLQFISRLVRLGYPVLDLLTGLSLMALHGDNISLSFGTFHIRNVNPRNLNSPFESVDNLRSWSHSRSVPAVRKYLLDYCHYLGRVSLPAEYDNVIGIPDDTGSNRCLQLCRVPYPVHQMQIQIGQQR